MTSTVPALRPVQASLLRAAAFLDAAADQPEQRPEALRQASLAIEHHLDTIARELSRRSIEPRLQGRAAEIEQRLKGTLAQVWHVEAALTSGAAHTAAFQELAKTVAEIADDEIDLVFEQLRDVGAMD